MASSARPPTTELKASAAPAKREVHACVSIGASGEEKTVDLEMPSK